MSVSLTESIGFMEAENKRLANENESLNKTKALFEDQLHNLETENAELRRSISQSRELHEMQISVAENQRKTAQARVESVLHLIEAAAKTLIEGAETLNDEKTQRPANTDPRQVRVRDPQPEDRLPAPAFLTNGESTK